MKNLKGKILAIVIVALMASGAAYYLTRHDHKTILKTVPPIAKSTMPAHHNVPTATIHF